MGAVIRDGKFVELTYKVTDAAGRTIVVRRPPLGQVLATVAVNTIVAVPVHASVRRWLTPALPDDPRRRRRRAYTTGGLSPLSRA